MTGATVQERVLAAAGAAVASRAPRDEVAAAIVEDLHEAIAYDAMHIAVVDPFSGSHTTLVNAGYSDRVVGYIESDYSLRDRAFEDLVRDGVPLRMRDTPFDYRQSYSYVEYWGPEGYGDGMATPLYGADGRYVGLASTSTETEAPLTDEIRGFMALLAGVLGAAIDPLADLGAWFDGAPDAQRLAIRADGSVLRRGESDGPCDVDPSVLSLAAAGLEAGPLPSRTGLVADRSGRLVQVQLTVARSPRLSPDPLVLATLRDAGQPFGLTQRETVVLRHLVDGGSNREIAEVLGIAPRTIATHIEHLLHKLGVETRTAAAASAHEHGLLRLDVRPGRTAR